MSTNISLSIIKELTKFRLTLSVVFSSFISYFLGASEVNFIQLFYLIAGGILIVSSSNIFNQIIERDLDKLMKRTQNRPLPKKEITPKLALFLAILSALIGLIFMYLINLKVAILAAHRPGPAHASHPAGAAAPGDDRGGGEPHARGHRDR